jgi:hypothetical protein
MDKEISHMQNFWYFTFGSGHKHPNGYVKIHGTFDEARQEMCNRFGEKWAFQYRTAEDAGVDAYNLYEVLPDCSVN